MNFTPFSNSELRAAFATRASTPASIVAERAAAARRLRVGIFAPEALVAREGYIARERAIEAAYEAAERAAEAWFIANQDSMVWIVGTNHDTPVASYLDGAANVRLCTDVDCCNGVLETFEQQQERLAYWSGGRATPARESHVFPVFA